MATNKRAKFEKDMKNLYERADRLGWDQTKRAKAYNRLAIKHKSYLKSWENMTTEPRKKFRR